MYVALYRKYRPKLFDDILSQDHITSTLRNEVKSGKVSHAYIFTGPKGTGKTSCAKIFSKAINCENVLNGEPCYRCDICKGLEDETILDVVEMDGASNNSVNDIRVLIDEAVFVPTKCRYRVYIIDEAHMLSSSAFNALLKIMEDPPSYVVFILATTDIYKIPATVLSRCQRFDFNRIKILDIENRLKYICEKENVYITKDAIKKLAAMSFGAMRDAISMLDQCIMVCENIDLSIVKKILNIVDDSYVLKLHSAIVEKDVSKIVQILNDLYYGGKNLEYVVLELIDFYHEFLYFCIFKDKANDVLEYIKYLDNSNKNNINTRYIIDVLEKLLDCSNNIKSARNKKLYLELFLLKLCFENYTYICDDSADLVNCSYNKKNDVSSSNVVFFTKWDEILLELKKSNLSLYDFFKDFRAYIKTEDMCIYFEDCVLSDNISENVKLLKDFVKNKTGKIYNILFKNDKNKSNLEKFLEVAKKQNIDVIED